jgi:hypothetical protein
VIVFHRYVYGIVLATVAWLVAGPDAAGAENAWPGAAGNFGVAQVDIPAGGIPPGPAVAEIDEPRTIRFKTRFAMPATGPAKVRIWDDQGGPGGAEVDVVVRSTAGAVWRTRIVRPEGGGETHTDPLFLGTADEMAALVNAAAESAGAQGALAGLALGSRAEIQAPDCRRLARPRVVVAVLAAGQSATPLLACVAEGAAIVVIGGLPSPELDSSRAVSPAVPEPIAWGLGVVVRVPTLTAGIGGAIAAVAAVERPDALLGSPYGPSDFAAPADSRGQDGVPASGWVLALLALYVVVIGPVGYVVGVRPRRPLLAWSWFPLVALATTAALAIVSSAWRSKPTQLEVTRLRVTSPTGVGLEAIDLGLYGNHADRFTVAAAAAGDADLRSARRGFRFGTPFSSPSGSLTVTDDRVASRMTFDGLSVGRFGSAGAGFIAPVTGSAPRLVPRDGRVVVVNRTERTVRRAFLIRGGTACRVPAPIPAGGESPLGSCAPLPPEEYDKDWFTNGVYRLAQVRLPVDGYALVVETEATAVAAVAEPDVAMIAHEAQVVVGVDATPPVPR